MKYIKLYESHSEYEEITFTEIKTPSSWTGNELFIDKEIMIIKNLLNCRIQYYKDRSGTTSDKATMLEIYGTEGKVRNLILARVTKVKDEWYYVLSKFDKYYKCDQFDGLIKCLKDNI